MGTMQCRNIFTFCCCCSVAKSCLTLCDPMDCSTPGFPVLYYHPEFAQIHVHWVAVQPSHLLLPPSPPALNFYLYIAIIIWLICTRILKHSGNCVDSSASENLYFATLFWDIFSRGKSYKNISEWLCNL